MRPIKVEMNYFGPYAHGVVDFDRFTASPLFLISGQTGAGKTTIFDAMTYALFGEGSGSRKPEDMRSDFATLNDTTSVRFWFEQQGTTYLVTRTPAQERDAKRGSGTTMGLASCAVSEYDMVTKQEHGTSYTKKKDVDEFIKDLISLTADQFRQIILLPQAQFQKFLTADSGDKEKVLRDLFGTKLFLDFSEQLKMQASELGKQQEAQTTQINNLFEQVKWTEDEALAFQAARTLAEKQACLAAKVNDQQAANMQAQLQLTTLDEQLTVKTQALTAGELLQKDFARLAALMQEQTELSAQSQLMAANQAEVRKLQWVNQQAPLMDQYQQLSQALPNLATQVTTMAANVATLTAENAQLTVTANELAQVQPMIDEAIITQGKITNYLIPLAERKLRLSANMDAADANARMVQAKISTQNKQIKTTESQLATQNTELTHDPDFTAASTQLVTLQADIKQANNVAEKLAEGQQSLAQVAEQKATIEVQSAKLTTVIAAANQAVDQQRQRRQSLMIAQLQNELTDGQACIVCGALEHPAVTKMAHQQVTDAEIRAAIDELEAQQTALAENTAQAQVLAEKLMELTASQQAKQAQVTTLTIELGELNTALGELVQREFTVAGPAEFNFSAWQQVVALIQTDLNKQQAHHKALQANIDTLNDQLKNDRQQLAEYQTKEAQYIGIRKTNAAELADISTEVRDLATVKEYQTELSTITTKIDLHQTKVTKLQAQQQQQQIALADAKAKHTSLQAQQTSVATELTAVTKQLTAALATKTTVSTLDELEALIAQERRENRQEILTKILAAYETNQKRVVTEIKMLKTTLKDKQQPDLTAIKATIEELKVQQQAAQTIQTEVYAQVMQLEQTQDAITKIVTAIGKQADVLNQLTQLAAAVNGKNDRRLTLERYVLQSYLIEVLEYANEYYFADLTNGRYQFDINQATGSYATKTGLEINIYDNDADEFRSVDTLSGGETFLASLAIALSLAEVIQNKAGGIRIDALFIDEGFGSLDEETLEKAMEALNKLERSGRIIGIISHVESMKQEIQQQLKVVKGGDGQSELKYQLA